MDKNQIIGITLITALFIAYLAFFNKTTPVPDTKITDTTVTVSPPAKEQLQAADSAQPDEVSKKYGTLASLAKGMAKPVVVQNEELQVAFNSKGGSIESVLLKKYLTDQKEPLYLITPQTSDIDLIVQTSNGEVNLKDLYYEPSTLTNGDTTVVSFRASLSDKQYIEQIYKFPKNGYSISYNITMQGMDDIIFNAPAKYIWDYKANKVEYDIEESRKKSAINYYLKDESFEQMGLAPEGGEEEVVAEPIRWVAMKQKFFISSIIAANAFESGKLTTNAAPSDSIVKTMQANMVIPVADFKGGKANFTYFFGPLHFQTLKAMPYDFHKNVDLGWPLVNWINRFIVIPTFNFLDGIFGDMTWKYGFIIIILGLLVKLILLPLSYKSFVAMAKMKVMKPELDALKEKHGDDMQKAQMEQMELYRKVGINPVSGCIPMLLSMPIILALFSFFPNSIELRQEAFLWANDLSIYDAPIKLPFTIPFYGAHVSIFTLLMTLSTLAYTHYNNQMSTATGPMRSVSYLMPVIFLFLLNSFPAGLSFYYLVSNILSIGQQMLIKRFVDEDKIKKTLDENRKKSPTGGKKSKFMQRVEEAMKAKEEQARKQQKKK